MAEGSIGEGAATGAAGVDAREEPFAEARRAELAAMARERLGQEREANPRLRPSSVIGRTFAIWARNIPAFTLVCLLLELPVLALLAWPDPDGTVIVYNGIGWTRQLVGLVCGNLVSAVLIFSVLEQLRGRKASLGDCFSRAMRRIGVVLGTSILMFLVMAVPFLPTAILYLAGNDLVSSSLAAIITAPITLLLTVRLYPLVAVAVLEDHGIVGCFGRAWRLSSKATLRIFLVVMVLGGASFLPGFVATIIARYPPGSKSALVLSTIFAVIFTGPLLAVCTSVVYHDLRREKEGFDFDELLAEFD